MSGAALRIGHGNGHNEDSLVEQIRHRLWHSFGCNEMERKIGHLQAVPSSKVFVTDLDFDRSKDTPILVADDFIIHNSWAKKVSKALGRKGSALNRVAPARVLTAVAYGHPLANELGLKGVMHFNLHPVAGPKQLTGRNPNAPIVKEYRAAMKELRQAWRAAKKAGYLCVLTGDLQLGKGVHRPWSPWTTAKLLGASYRVVKIDWIMFDRRVECAELDTFPLYDHTGFIAKLIRKARKK